MVLMHVGLTGPLCRLPRPESWEPCPSKKVPHYPQTQTSNVLRVHEKGSQINMPECRQGFTLMQMQWLRFPPHSHSLSKSPTKGSSLSGSPVERLHRERCSIARALSTCLSRSPETKPLLQVPFTEPLHRGRCSISRALFTWLSKSPEKKPPSRFPLQSPYIEKDAPSPEPSLCIFQSLQKRNRPSGFPLQSPYIEKDVPSSKPSVHIFKIPRN
jgi:hypothetical protein